MSNCPKIVVGMTEPNPNRIDLEVTGSEIPLLKALLDKVKLSDDIERVSIEIESNSRLTSLGEQITENESDGTESDVSEEAEEAEEDESEPEENTQRHVTDALTQPEAADEYLDGEKDPVEKIDTPLTEGTHKWYICAIFYRTQGWLEPKQLIALLDDTDWTVAASSVYSQLATLVEGGILLHDEENSEYQMTQLGRDAFEQLVHETDGYSIRPADRVTTDDESNATPAAGD